MARNPFNDMIIKANKIVFKYEDVKLENTVNAPNKINMFYQSGGHSVILKMVRDNSGPYHKEFSCDCTHNALYGAKRGTPCAHIIAVIIWEGVRREIIE